MDGPYTSPTLPEGLCGFAAPSDGQSDGGSASDGESSGGFGLRPPDRYARGLVARPFKKSRTDEGGGDGGGGDGGGGAPAVDDAPRPKRKPGDWAARVLREFLASALARGTYITVTVPSEIHVDEAGEAIRSADFETDVDELAGRGRLERANEVSLS